MTRTSRWHLIFPVLLLFVCSSCASRGGASSAESARVDNLISQVHIGDSRKQVEQRLGRPYRTETEGKDLVMTYISRFDQGSSTANSSQQTLGVFSSLLNSVGSIGGSSLGAASSVGSQALSAGTALNSGSSATGSSGEATIKVRLRSNKVASVERSDSGRVGIGSEY